MKRLRLYFGLLVALSLIVPASSVGAAPGLQLRPLVYRDHLDSGSVKQGFLDISNPDEHAVEIMTSVQGFRQIDDQGTLQFYDDPALAKAILPDVQDVELGPHEALRLYFSIDSNRLPAGDVFAVIFARTVPKSDQQIGQSVQVGTLLVLENGQTGARQASLQSLTMPFVQFGGGVQARAVVHNDATSGTATGFYPELRMSLSPWGPQGQIEAPLVFAGHSRQVEVSLPANLFGFYMLTAKVGGTQQSQLLFAMTGYWQWLGPLVILGVMVGLVWLVRRLLRAR